MEYKQKYYSAPNVKVYINGVYVEEIYDIQYQYRELKEPIYGYLSKHYDHVVRGTVIVTGAFSLNYTHDQYLPAVLWMGTDPDGAGSEQARENPSKSYYDKLKTFKDSLAIYKDALSKSESFSDIIKQSISVGNTQNAVMAVQSKEDNALLNDPQNNKLDAKTKADNFYKFIDGEKAKGERESSEIAVLNRAEINRKAIIYNYTNKVSTLKEKYETDADKIFRQITTDTSKAERETISKLVDLRTSEYHDDLSKALDNKNASLNALIESSPLVSRYFDLLDELDYTTSELNKVNQYITSGQNNTQDTNNFIGTTAKGFIGNLKTSGVLDFLNNIQLPNEATAKLTDIKNALSVEIKPQDVAGVMKKIQEALIILNNPGVQEKVNGYVTDLKNKAQQAKDESSPNVIALAQSSKWNYAPGRAEDHEDYGTIELPQTFDMTLEYDTVPHVRLVDVHIISHSKAVTQSGQGIKLIYQFICKNIESPSDWLKSANNGGTARTQ